VKKIVLHAQLSKQLSTTLIYSVCHPWYTSRASLVLKCVYLLFLDFFMYYNMNQGLSLLHCECHNDTSFVACKVLFINNVIFSYLIYNNIDKLLII
jgi:hypothetical protein